MDKMFIAFSCKGVTLSEDFLINCWANQWSGEAIQTSRPYEAEMSQ